MKSSLLFVAMASLAVLACGNSSPKSSDGGGSSGWAVGKNGVMIETTDQTTWVAKSANAVSGSWNTNVDLHAISCVGPLVGWAVGSAGTILFTSDGGNSWTPQSSHTTADLHGVRFIDASHGVAAGDHGTLLSTSDGGSTWNAIEGFTTNFTGVTSASAASSFFVVGDGGTVLISHDAGSSFTSRSIANAGYFKAVSSDVSGQHVYAVGSSGNIFASLSGKDFVLENATSLPLESIAVSDSGSLVVATGADGVISERTPLGVWKTSVPVTSDLHSAAFMGESAFVAGENGSLLTLRNGTWVSLNSNTTLAIYGLENL